MLNVVSPELLCLAGGGQDSSSSVALGLAFEPVRAGSRRRWRIAGRFSRSGLGRHDRRRLRRRLGRSRWSSADSGVAGGVAACGFAGAELGHGRRRGRLRLRRLALGHHHRRRGRGQLLRRRFCGRRRAGYRLGALGRDFRRRGRRLIGDRLAGLGGSGLGRRLDARGGIAGGLLGRRLGFRGPRQTASAASAAATARIVRRAVSAVVAAAAPALGDAATHGLHPAATGQRRDGQQ